MKALSMLQPWATLVAVGAKRYETRSWPSRHRGPLAIHASARFPAAVRRLCAEEPLRSTLAAAGYGRAPDLPLGCVLAIARLADCLPAGSLLALPLTPHEAAFGDFSPGRWAWRLENVARLPAPLPARGALGLWEWSES